MFWRKREQEKVKDKVLDDLLDMFKIVSAQLSTHDKEIDMLKVRLKNKAFKGTEIEENTVDEKKVDGFDGIRDINKHINDGRIGL